MKRFLCVLAAVAMTMLLNSVQAEDQDWSTWTSGNKTLTENVTLTGGPAKLKESITLDGQNHTVSGNNSFRALDFDPDCSLFSLSNVIFDRCYTSDYCGAVIHVGDQDDNESFTIQVGNAPLTFSNNSTDYDGGAILSRRPLTIEGIQNELCAVKFLGNKSSDYRGGAICSTENVILSDFGSLKFDQNSAGDTGGAIATPGRLRLSPTATVPDDDCSVIIKNVSGSVEFTKNSAGESGGAIGSELQSIKIENIQGELKFTENYAGSYGGAISCGRGSDVVFYKNANISFSGNYTNNSDEGYGGAIYSRNDVAFYNNTKVTFSGNYVGTNDSKTPDDIYAGGNVIIQGGEYSFDGGIIADGNIEISPYKEGETTKATTVFFDCDLTATTVSITDSTVTFGSPEALESPAMVPTVASTPGLVGKEVFLKSEDMKLQSETVNTNDAIKNTVVMLNADSDKTYTVTGELIADKSTVNAPNLVIDGKLTNKNGSTLNYISLSVGSLEIGSGSTMSSDSLTISNDGDLTLSGGVLNMTFMELLIVDTATLTGTINIGGTGNEVTDQPLLTGTTSLDSTGLSVFYTGSGDFDFSWEQSGNSIVYTLKSKGGSEAVPEPSTWALLILGSMGLLWLRKRERCKA